MGGRSATHVSAEPEDQRAHLGGTSSGLESGFGQPGAPEEDVLYVIGYILYILCYISYIIYYRFQVYIYIYHYLSYRQYCKHTRTWNIHKGSSRALNIIPK